MTEDIEMISFKILKILYQYHQQNPDLGLNDEGLAGRFDFKDQKKGLKLLQKALTEMKNQSLLRQVGASGHAISDQGIQHYEQFKFIKGDEESVSYPVNVTINGNISEFQNRPHYYSHHYHHLHGQNITFPGDIKEFIPHHNDLLKTVEAIEKLVMDVPKGEEILNKLETMKAILNQDSSLNDSD